MLVGLVYLLLAHTHPVQAAGVVTNCTGTGLANAMNSGSGLITFNCGPSPVVITVTQAGGFNAIAGRFYTIDGGNLVTLTGAGANRLFNIQAANAALTLTNIILTDGNASAGGDVPTVGGAILNQGGRLVLDHVTIRDSQSYYAGGAIRDSNGTTIIMNSLIENNQSQYGGGIDSGGTLTLINTIVRNNQATVHEGGGLDVGGTVVISNSQITGNSAYGSANGGGGGVNIVASGRVSISGSQLSANQTPTQTTAATGGAIRNLGLLTILDSTLSGNSANDGGGIYDESTSTATLDRVILSGNSGYDGGGGIYNNGNSILTLNNSTLSGNFGGGGGGLFNYATALLNNSTLSGNSANAGGGMFNLGMTTLTNTTLSGNSAVNGGGLYNYFDARLVNVTLSNNSATAGGALYMQSGYTTVLTNAIVAYSPSGGNCSGSIAASTFTFSSDNSCALPAGNTIHGMNPNGLDPLLTALGNYGGPTQVHMLKLGSPAIAGIVGNAAPLTDQRSLPRPEADGSFDIGAVERQLADSNLAPRLYLPLIVR
ncbi:MAG: hypothetical protein HZB53_18545 [Chloroflexi bacterium]|nr:hypothetical protein [Chloroflexota bacterium]